MSYFKKETYLSNTVHQIFVDVHEKNKNYKALEEKEKVIENLLDENGLFVWNELDNLLELKDLYVSHNKNLLYKCMLKFSPLFYKICEHFKNKFLIFTSTNNFSHHENILQRINASKLTFMQKYELYYSWTHSKNVFERCIQILFSDGKYRKLHSLLLLTPLLEKSLGNFLPVGTNNPQKLSLIIPLLKNTLPHSCLSLLTLLVGPPTSLNLRNVLWHGFVLNDDEIHESYPFVLISLILSIGKFLRTNRIERTIKKPKIYLKQTFLPEPHIIPLEVIEISMKKIEHIDTGLLSLLISLFNQKRYGEVLVLSFPLLENQLRCMYAHCNKLEHSVLTAESASMFTTLDEILSRTIKDQTQSLNRLPNLLERPLLTILMDMLMYPHGPRLRDRVSHADIPVISSPHKSSSASSFFSQNNLCSSTVSANIAHSVLSILLVVLYKAEQMIDGGVSSNHYDPMLLCGVHKRLRRYKSQFHLTSLLITEFSSANEALTKFKTLLHKHEFNHVPELTVSDQMEQTLIHKLGLETEMFSSFCVTNTHLIDSFDCLYRYEIYPEEKATTLLVMSLVTEISVVLQHLEGYITDTKIAFDNKSLRSRQRKNFENFTDKSLPFLLRIMMMLVCTASIFIYSLNLKSINRKIKDENCLIEKDTTCSNLCPSTKFLKRLKMLTDKLVCTLKSRKWLEFEQGLKNDLIELINS